MLLTAVAVAITLFFWPAELVSAQYLPPTCPGNITSLNGASPTASSMLEPFIEIVFKLNFECERAPEFIDEGVRLEVRLYSATSNSTTDWFPIKYYTNTATLPTGYSLVKLHSNTEVAVQDDLYNTTLPLMIVTSGTGELITIREYICGQVVQSLTEDMQLEVRWLQRYGRRAENNVVATWILDDINIRIWNRTSFLQVLSEDFSASDQVIYDSYEVKSVEITQSICELKPEVFGRFLRFIGITGGITRRSINIVNDMIKISISSEESSESTTMATPDTTTTTSGSVESTLTSTPEPATSVADILSKVSRAVILPEIGAQIFLEEYGDPVPQAISDDVLAAATDILTSISSEDDPTAGGRVLEFLDIFVFKGYNSSLGKFSNDIFTFQVIDVSADNFTNPEDRLLVLNETEGTISLPWELFSKCFSKVIKDIRVVSFIFKNLSGILPVVTDDDEIKSNFGSPVVSATLGCINGSCRCSDIMLKYPVLFEIHNFDNSSDNETAGFYFFDLEKFIWSSRGCTCNSTLFNPSFSVCECDHLTHFAILLSPGLKIDAKNTFALKHIGYVGIAFSVFCMIAVIFTLTFLKSLWDMRTFIHINLCVCLIISQVIFISAVDKSSIKQLCQAIAIVLHYSFLTTFMWMLMEGVFLYLMLVRVFIKRQYLYMIGFTVASYGLPALYVFCVAVPLGLTIKDEQGFPQYGSFNEFEGCWLRSDNKFIWAFIAPVLIINMINIGFFIMAISIMKKHKKRGREESKLKNARYWLKTAISLMVVMGIPWIIGILVFHKVLIFVAYIFTIITAFQGMFIFILFVLLSKQVILMSISPIASCCFVSLAYEYRIPTTSANLSHKKVPQRPSPALLTSSLSNARHRFFLSSALYRDLSEKVKDHYRSWWRGKKGESKYLSKLFASSLETKSDSLPATKKQVKTTSNGKDTAKKMIDHKVNICKYGYPSSNDYVTVMFTNRQCVDPNGDVHKLEAIYVNQSNDTDKNYKNNPKERSF